MNFITRKNEKMSNIENSSKQNNKGIISGNELGYSMYKAIEFRNTGNDKHNLMLQFEYVRNRF